MEETPIYTEVHRSYGWYITILVPFTILYSLVFAVHGWPNAKNIITWEMTTILALMLSWPSLTGSPWPYVICFYPDKFTVGLRKKVLHTIRYADIKTVWNSDYLLETRSRRKGTLKLEPFPGRKHHKAKSLLKRIFYSEYAPGEDLSSYIAGDNILVWKYSTQENMGHKSIPLTIHRTGHWDLLHVKDEKRVIELLKKQAPWIKLPEYYL